MMTSYNEFNWSLKIQNITVLKKIHFKLEIKIKKITIILIVIFKLAYKMSFQVITSIMKDIGDSKVLQTDKNSKISKKQKELFLKKVEQEQVNIKEVSKTIFSHLFFN